MTVPERIERVDNPCKPDCPKRSIHCHSNCKEYDEFVAYRDAVRRAREKHLEEYNFARAVHRANLGGHLRR